MPRFTRLSIAGLVLSFLLGCIAIAPEVDRVAASTARNCQKNPRFTASQRSTFW